MHFEKGELELSRILEPRSRQSYSTSYLDVCRGVQGLGIAMTGLAPLRTLGVDIQAVLKL